MTLVTAFDSYTSPEWTALRDAIKAKSDKLGFLIVVEEKWHQLVSKELEGVENVIILNDIPMHSVLNHLNVSLCITTGDAHALMESFYFGKPVLIKFVKDAPHKIAL